MILVSASFSYFTLAVSMREVSCLGYTPRAWDLRSLQSILDGLLYLAVRTGNIVIDRPIWVYYENNNNAIFNYPYLI